jgi:hypothetical protein
VTFCEVTDWSEVLPNVLAFQPSVPMPPDPEGAKVSLRPPGTIENNAFLTGEEQHKNRTVPLVSRTYNLHMGAVDVFDKDISSNTPSELSLDRSLHSGFIQDDN